MSQKEYVLKRSGLTVLTIIFVASMLFLLFRLAPGDPSYVYMAPGMGPEERAMIRENLGLDRPLHIQYIYYMKGLVVGDLGQSFVYRQPVANLLMNKLLNTIALSGTSVVLAMIIGPLIGAFMAWNRNNKIDVYGISVVLGLRSAPVFWTGMMAIMVFSFELGWLPSGGMHSVSNSPSGLVAKFVSIDFVMHLILPVTVTTAYLIGSPALIMRNNMTDILGADFIAMKQAEGVPDLHILYKHAARNALLPVLHYGAIALGFVFGGSVIIEAVFSWPGVGRLLWTAVLKQDYPVAQGAFLMIAVVIITLNFFVDVISVYVDPRVAEEEN